MSALTDVTTKHRRTLLRACPCGQRHSRSHWLYLRDQRARIIHPGGEAGARAAGWAAYRKAAS